MENKLQELTRKLYDEGLSKGQQEAQQLVAQAKEQAKEIVEEAQAQARTIIKEAEKSAEETKRNTATEVELASRQSIGILKQQIEKMIVFNAVSPEVAKANDDPEFIKNMLLTLASSWNGASSDKADLMASLPEDKKAALEKMIKASAASQLAGGLDISFDKKVKSGFRIGPKDGSYYISFSNDDFNALISEYLRPQVEKMLFSEK